MARRVAVVNYSADSHTAMRDQLVDEGYETLVCPASDTACEQVRAYDPDAIVLDVRTDQPHVAWPLLEVFTLDPLLTLKPIIVWSPDAIALRQAALPRRRSYIMDKWTRIVTKPVAAVDLLHVLAEEIGSPM